MLNHELFFLDELKLKVSASAAVTALVNCKCKIISLNLWMGVVFFITC